MIIPEQFFNALRDKAGVSFFTGVPDSLLKNFCAYVTDNSSKEQHVIAANEGAAVALGAGYHLATGSLSCVYMQNSGQGNATNPLLSLADPEVYSIPMLLVVGWRGEPGVKDEPQHRKQGVVTEKLFTAMDIPYAVLPDEWEAALSTTTALVAQARKESRPVALLVRKGTFAPYTPVRVEEEVREYPLNLEEVIQTIVAELDPTAVIVSTTGKTSRELFEYRATAGTGHGRDFLTVGSMGHASQIALGIALARPEQQVYCFDGDGALIMHMGGLTTIGQSTAGNLKHIVLNNGAHDSVGGQPTVGFGINIPEIATASGYRWAQQADDAASLRRQLALLQNQVGPALLEVRIRKGTRKDLGRPTTTPIENKSAFMNTLNVDI